MQHKKTSKRSKSASLLAILTSLTITFAALPFGQQHAAAADIGDQLVVTTATITGPDEPVTNWGEFYHLAGHICVPDSAVAGDSWSWRLPSVLSWPKHFELVNKEETVVTVDITDNVAAFTLTPAGAQQTNLCSDYEVDGQLIFNTGLGEHELKIETPQGVIASKTVNVRRAPFFDLPQSYWKQLWFNNTDQCRTDTANCFTTALTLKAGDHGNIHVSEAAKENWEFSCDTLMMTLRDHKAEITYDANAALAMFPAPHAN